MAMEKPSAVQFFVPDNPQRKKTIRSQLTELVAKEVAALGSNFAQDWPDYKFRTGRIAALNDAIQICEAAEETEGSR